MKFSILITFIFCIFYNSHAEPSYHPAVIWSGDNEPFFCEVEVYSEGIILSKSRIEYKIGSKLYDIPLKDIRRITMDGYNFVPINVKLKYKCGPNAGKYRNVRRLARIEKNGSYKLYHTFHFGHQKSIFHRELYERTYLSDGGKLHAINTLNYKSSIKSILRSNPEFAQLIDSNLLHFNEVDLLVDLLNAGDRGLLKGATGIL